VGSRPNPNICRERKEKGKDRDFGLASDMSTILRDLLTFLLRFVLALETYISEARERGEEGAFLFPVRSHLEEAPGNGNPKR
jgi:hypothetical protein